MSINKPLRDYYSCLLPGCVVAIIFVWIIPRGDGGGGGRRHFYGNRNRILTILCASPSHLYTASLHRQHTSLTITKRIEQSRKMPKKNEPSSDGSTWKIRIGKKRRGSHDDDDDDDGTMMMMTIMIQQADKSPLTSVSDIFLR